MHVLQLLPHEKVLEEAATILIVLIPVTSNRAQIRQMNYLFAIVGVLKTEQVL